MPVSAPVLRSARSEIRRDYGGGQSAPGRPRHSSKSLMQPAASRQSVHIVLQVLSEHDSKQIASLPQRSKAP